jgi:cytochrome c oxidase assembly protein subunit 15
MHVPRLSPGAFRNLALVTVVLLVAIIVSGAAVRLTNSGLGCADWPACSGTKFVDVSSNHAAIEQFNRLFSGAIGIPIVLLLAGAYRRVPRRDDLVRPAWVLLALFGSEAVLGGITVKVELDWISVMAHFLLAIALVGVALLIHRRAGMPDSAQTRARVVGPMIEALVLAVYALTVWVLVWGTLLTAAGPHGGDEEARRLGWPIPDVARVHAVSVDVLVALVVVLLVVLVRTRAPRPVLVAASLTLLAMTAQGVLGYVQYAQSIPALLVGFHVLGAALVFVAVQELLFTVRPPVARAGPRSDGSGARAGTADRPREPRADVAGVRAGTHGAHAVHLVEDGEDGGAHFLGERTP